MWFRCLLKTTAFLWLFAPDTPAAQGVQCDQEGSIDSAIQHIGERYSYTSPGWQKACDSLLAICPQSDRVWQVKAMPHIKMGNWEGCFLNLEHAVAINPKRWLAYQAFLKCIFAKDYRAALLDFNRCDSIVPGTGIMDHSYDFYRGLSCLGLKDYGNGLAWLRKDVDRQAKHFGAGNVHYVSVFYMGLAYQLNEKYDSAIGWFRRCLKTYPQYPEPSYYLGLALLSKSRKEEAQACFRTAKESLRAGYSSNEDQEFYVNYPYSISLREVEEQLNKL